MSGRGRPALRTAAWRAVWGALAHNSVYAARYHHLTTRTTSQTARPGPPSPVLYCQLFVVVTRRIAWDPAIAAAERHEEVVDSAA